MSDPTKKHAFKRDEAYWAALLQAVEELPPAPEPAEEGTGRAVAALPELWAAAEQALREETTFTLTPSGYNKGGLLVDWNGLSGFVPASQLSDFSNLHLEEERAQELVRRRQRPITVRIIEVNPHKNRLVLSERAALAPPEQRRNLWDEIAPGDRRDGVVTNLTNFGAFVDLGGVEGLIHISELTWSRIQHPGDVVKPGQPVTCIVLEVSRPHGRIALSLKRMRPDPWAGVEQRYRPGQIVTGAINQIEPYGAFVTLEVELEGLIHHSEWGDDRSMLAAGTVGQTVRARVLSVNSRSRRIALSLRDVPRADEAEPGAL